MKKGNMYFRKNERVRSFVALTIAMLFALNTLAGIPANVKAVDTLYNGDGSCYSTGTASASKVTFNLDESISNYTYLLPGDSVDWTSSTKDAYRVQEVGIHNPDRFCGYSDSAKMQCGHYGAPRVDHFRRVGIDFSYKNGAKEKVTVTKKSYEIQRVNESETTESASGDLIPANTVVTEEVDVDETLVAETTPVRIRFVNDATPDYSYARCGNKNDGNEFIAYETYRNDIGASMEVEALAASKVPVVYDLAGGAVQAGNGLPSYFNIEKNNYIYSGNQPVRLGYRFSTWKNATEGSHFVSARDDGKIAVGYLNYSWWDTINKEVASPNTLVAQWSASNVYLSLDPNGGVYNDSKEVTELPKILYSNETGEDTSYLTAASCEGKTFLGWYIGDTKITCINDIPKSAWNKGNDYVLTAKWSDGAGSASTPSTPSNPTGESGAQQAGHKHDNKDCKNKTDATYFDAGYTGDQYCKGCGALITKGQEIAKLKLAKPVLKTAKSSKKKQLTISWSTVKDATAYEIQYSTSSKFAKKKTKSLHISNKNAKTMKKTIKKLSSKKKYYVRMNVYITGHTAAGKKVSVDSGWTSKKTVKVK